MDVGGIKMDIEGLFLNLIGQGVGRMIKDNQTGYEINRRYFLLDGMYKEGNRYDLIYKHGKHEMVANMQLIKLY